MKAGLIFIVAALTSSPQPAPNYYSWIAPEISEIVVNCIIQGRSYSHLDFNGDGELTIADAVGISRRYQDNVKYGNEITLDSETIYDIGWENFSDGIERQEFIENLLYYEIDTVNGTPCRQYELTVSEVTEARIYYEFETYSDTITVTLDPYKEYIQVKEDTE